MLRRTMLMAAAVLTLAAPAQARTWRIAPDADAEQQIAAALASAQAGDEVRLERGRYEMRAPLRMDARGVTLRGAGEDRSVLAFVGAQGGLVITGDMGVVRDLAIEDAPGDGVSARRCDQLSLLGVRVEWTRGGLPSNGAHAIAAAQCANVLIDGAIARGARAAGFYLSQTRAVVLRNSTAEGNGAGVMLENTLGADVHDNSVRNNALGVLVLNRPELGGGGEAGDVLIAKNMIEANSLASFAPRGALPGDAPGGVGVAIIAGRNTHVLHNQIADNPSVNVFIGAYRGAVAQAGFNPLSRDIAVRDNRLGRSGFAPSG
ncbi:MAG: parallel beta-helix domain-containing protein, partial [Hyphomonadaceae bacterium]